MRKILSVTTKVKLPDVEKGAKGRPIIGNSAWSFDPLNRNATYYTQEQIERNPDIFHVEYEL